MGRINIASFLGKNYKIIIIASSILLFGLMLAFGIFKGDFLETLGNGRFL